MNQDDGSLNFLKIKLTNMKSYFDNKPSDILDLGNGKYHLYWNIEEYANEEQSGWKSDYIEVDSLEYGDVVNSLIRRKYSLSDEISIQRQKEAKPIEFKAYFDYCEECKNIAKSILF